MTFSIPPPGVIFHIDIAVFSILSAHIGAVFFVLFMHISADVFILFFSPICLFSGNDMLTIAKETKEQQRLFFRYVNHD